MVDFTTNKAIPSTVTITMQPSPATSSITVTPTVATLTPTDIAMPTTVSATTTTAQRPSLDVKPWEIIVYVLTAVLGNFFLFLLLFALPWR